MSSVTMDDIAGRAGVSRKSVYGILNNKPGIRVSDKTREKVLALARELNYAPNHFAKSLKTGKTNIIGVTSGTGIPIRLLFNDLYFADLYTGIGQAAAEHGYRILFQQSAEGSVYESMEMALSNMVDGSIFVLLSEYMDDFYQYQLPKLRELAVPFSVITTFAPSFNAPFVAVDAREGAYRTARHLLDHGYREFGFLYYAAPENPFNAALFDGFADALKERGLDPSSVTWLRGDHRDAAAGYRALDGFIRRNEPMPRAWFSTQVRMAEGAMVRVREAGIGVPEECAFAAYGRRMDDADRLSTLTVMRSPIVAAGKAAGDMLFDSMNGNEPCSRILRPELVCRGSCGCT